MSQHDYNIANGGGAAVRADINAALAAILSMNSGANAPTTTKPYMLWYDTTNALIKMRNSTDDGWVTVPQFTNDGGLQIQRTAVTSPASGDGNVFSGTYTPTFTNTTNITSSTPTTLYYTRVGNIVSVFGRVDVTATATGNTVLGVSLPISSNLTSNAQLSGSASYVSSTTANNTFGRINGDTTNDRALVQWNSTSTSALTYTVNFSYVVV